MKKPFKILGYGLLTITLLLLGFYLIKNEKLPEGIPSSEADQMALRMVESLNKAAWDTTKTVSWSFRGDHHYVWNRETNFVNAIWDDYEVGFNTQTKIGTVKNNGSTIEGEEADKALKTAWDNFNNDSFWLAAPFKVFDPGTERSIVQTRDGRTGLMVTYTSGGTTPGDSYVWMLDENYQPTSVKMWVSILPIGGMEFTWENYQTLGSGAMIAKDHAALSFLNIPLEGIK